MDEGERDREEGLSRRELLKAGAVVGATALTGLGAYLVVQSLTARPGRTEVRDTFVYVEAQGALATPWWEEAGLVGQEAFFVDFEPGRGANVLWRSVWDADGELAGGLPALLMGVDEADVTFPASYPKQEFIVDGVYAVFNCCTHACCRSGWKMREPPNYVEYLGYETLYCPCHDGQFHPDVVVEDQHPEPPIASGAPYIGVKPVAGPVERAMPLIPLEADGERIVGLLRYPGWYRYLDFRNASL